MEKITNNNYMYWFFAALSLAVSHWIIKGGAHKCLSADIGMLVWPLHHPHYFSLFLPPSGWLISHTRQDSGKSLLV